MKRRYLIFFLNIILVTGLWAQDEETECPFDEDDGKTELKEAWLKDFTFAPAVTGKIDPEKLKGKVVALEFWGYQ